MRATEVANDIYQKTHDGLAQMVSARAATRMLESGLQQRGLTADNIAEREMRRLLLGPIFRELEHILPRAGLKRNLQVLAASLKEVTNRNKTSSDKQQRREPAMTDHAAPDRARETGEPQDARAPITSLLNAIEAEQHEQQLISSSVGAASSAPSAPGFVATEPQAPRQEARPVRPAQQTKKDLSQEQLEQTVLRFAQLEHVKLVAAFGGGTIRASRGSGLDLTALARLGNMSLNLLGRSGKLRSYYLAVPQGQLFLFPCQQFTFAVYGSSTLNIGAVFTLFATLEEEL